MSFETYPSALLESAVNEMAKLPGIGRKTALRLVLHLLRQPDAEVDILGNTLLRLKHDIHYCRQCHNISDTELCSICADPKRDSTIICVVENVKDVISIENTHQYNGLYHVLGGIISPMEGIGPNELQIESLIVRSHEEKIKEIFLALSPTMEGDTTSYYIYKKLSSLPVKITTIARGIAIGNDLEYADEVTLGRSIINRTPFNQ
ncbi:MAG: recombination mediator RecR [Microbacter sp.]